MSEPKSGAATAPVAVLRWVFTEHRWAAVGLSISAFLAGLFESTILALVAHSATAMVNGDDRLDTGLGPVQVNAPVMGVLALAGVLALLRLAAALAVAYLPARIAADTQAALRNRLFDAYSRSSWGVQSEERDGHLQELLTGQALQATQSTLHATTLVASALTFGTLVLVAFALGPVTALLVLAVAVVLFGLLRPLAKQGRRYATALSAATLAYANAIGSAVRLAEETYTFGTAEAERRRVGERTDDTRHNYLRMQFASRLTQGLYQGLVILLLVGGLVVLNAAGAGQVASLGTVVLILVRAASYGQTLQVALQMIQQSAPYMERLDRAEASYRANLPTEGHLEFPTAQTFRLQNVSFWYRAGQPVLDDVSFDVEHGAVIGIVGPSGAGKSTLVQLLLRMREPTAGRLLLGDTPVDEITFESWRRNVAYVPQEPRLLDATVANNIRFLRDIDDTAIERGARLAQIHDTICSMPRGYDTVIGQRADAVSGGQRQRLCIARALAGSPSVMVLDEPTSALDMTSEAAIQASLRGLRGELTMFIVTHRESLLEICDRVIDVQAGHARARAAR